MSPPGMAVLPTVMAFGALAGEKLHASASLLPAATTRVTPDSNRY